nr:hypothetical protein CFP56_11128 [Quercus suber]
MACTNGEHLQHATRAGKRSNTAEKFVSQPTPACSLVSGFSACSWADVCDKVITGLSNGSRADTIEDPDIQACMCELGVRRNMINHPTTRLRGTFTMVGASAMGCATAGKPGRVPQTPSQRMYCMLQGYNILQVLDEPYVCWNHQVSVFGHFPGRRCIRKSGERLVRLVTSAVDRLETSCIRPIYSSFVSVAMGPCSVLLDDPRHLFEVAWINQGGEATKNICDADHGRCALNNWDGNFQMMLGESAGQSTDIGNDCRSERLCWSTGQKLRPMVAQRHAASDQAPVDLLCSALFIIR